jgi:PAS domain S-box-containing protein
MTDTSMPLDHPGLLLAAFRALPLPFAILDREGCIIAVNDAWRQAVNECCAWDADEPVGAPYLAVCNDAAGPDQTHVQPLQDALRHVLGGRLARFVRTYTAICGRDERPSQVVITALPMGGAVVVHQALAASSDSGRYRATRAREQDETLPRLAEHAPVLMWTCHPDGRPQWFNRRWLEFAGQTREQALADDWRSRIHPEDRARVVTTAQEARREQREYLHKFRLRRADGEYRWLHERGQPLYHPDGRSAGYIGSCSDITDIVRTEDDLARNRDHLHRQLQFAGTLNRMAQAIIGMEDQDHILESLVETLGRTLAVDHALIIDVRLGKQTAVVLSDWADPSCPVEVQRRGDYSLEQFAESLRHAWEMRTPLESHHDQVNPRLASEGSAELLHRRLGLRSLLWFPFAFRADGFLLLSINQLVRRRTWLGDEREFLAAVTNLVNLALQKTRMLVERRESALQRHQTGKMEAMGRLAGGIAHDFNNLLTTISGHTQLMLRGLPERHPLRNHAENVLKATERAAETTQHLQAFSRRQPLKPVATDPNRVVERLRLLIDRLVPATIAVETDLLASIGMVLADPGRLELALMQLAVNARDAMPDGGRLVITSREVLVDDQMGRRVGARPGVYISIAMRDTGIGMDPSTAEQIFEPFFTTKEPGHNTGLGLSSAYGAVRAMDGFITIDTAKGHGTTVVINLPKVVDEAVHTPSPLRLQALGGNETILLVEDNPGVLELARDALRNQGYRVLVAGDGDEALRVVQSHPNTIALLLTDLVLPGFNGQTLAIRLRALRPQLKVIFTSGYGADAFAPSHALGHSGFLAKPFTIDELMRAVRTAIDAKA